MLGPREATDAAFAALPAGTVETLLKPENKDRLIAVLTYHMVPGAVMSGDLMDGMKVATVQGGEVTIGTMGGVTVDGANVATADIAAAAYLNSQAVSRAFHCAVERVIQVFRRASRK